MTVIDHVLNDVLEDFEIIDYTDYSDARGASICAQARGQAIIIAVSGEIDASNADFTATILDGFSARNDAVVIDMTELDFIGTQGLRLLIEFHDRCQRSGTALTVVPGPMLRRLMQFVDVGRDLSVGESVDDAVRSVVRGVASVDSQPTFVAVDPAKLRC